MLNFLNNSSSAPAERGEALMNPVALLTAYYDAVNGRDYKQAYSHWETPRNNFRDFVRGYSDTLKVQVFIQQPASIEGAAGSLYAEIPTILISRSADNRERLFAGCYVMRKSNLSPSDISKEGTWRIYKANIYAVSDNSQSQDFWRKRVKNRIANCELDCE